MDEKKVVLEGIEDEDLESGEVDNDEELSVESDVTDAVGEDEGNDLGISTHVDRSDQASMLVSLEELIKNHIESIDKMRLELKKQKEMYDDSFINNPTYREHNEKVKEVTKGRTAVKQQIIKQPSVAQLDQKVKDMRFDIAEKNKTLSDLLQDYKEQTGATSIETRDGQVLEIISTSRLIRRSAK